MVCICLASQLPVYHEKGQHLFQTRTKIANTVSKSHLIMGDFNGRTAAVEDYILENNDQHSPAQDIDLYISDQPLPRNNSDMNPTDENGKKIIDLCKSARLQILNGRISGDRWGALTRYPIYRKEKPSLIDYGISSVNLLSAIKSFFVLPFTTLSDHCCITARVTANCDIEENETDTNDNKYKAITRPGFQLANTGKYKSNLEQDQRFTRILTRISARLTERNNPITQEDVDGWMETFTSSIQDNANKSFTEQNGRKAENKNRDRTKPAKWYNDACRKARNKLKRATSKLNKNPFNTSYQEKAVAARIEYKKICKQTESRHRKDLLDKLLNADDPKEFWRIMKNMQTWGRETEDPSTCIAPKTWEEYFKTLLNSTKKQPAEPPTKRCKGKVEVHEKAARQTTEEGSHHLYEAKITMKELQEAIQKMKYGKAAGPDGIVAEYIKFATTNVVKILLQLMNIIFSHALYPTTWTNNFLKAIYKSGPTDDPGNYRGLAIGSVMAKLYSTVLLNRLEIIVTERGILTKNQIGFIKGFRTADHIYVLKTLITKYTKKTRVNCLLHS